MFGDNLEQFDIGGILQNEYYLMFEVIGRKKNNAFKARGENMDTFSPERQETGKWRSENFAVKNHKGPY